MGIGHIELVSVDGDDRFVHDDICRSQFDQQLRVLGDRYLFEFASFGGEFVQVRGSIVEIDVCAVQVFVHRTGGYQFHFGRTDFSGDLLRHFREIDTQFGCLVFHETVKIACCRMDSD